MIVSHKHSVLCLNEDELERLGRLMKRIKTVGMPQDLSDFAWQLERVSTEGLKILRPEPAPEPKVDEAADIL